MGESVQHVLDAIRAFGTLKSEAIVFGLATALIVIDVCADIKRRGKSRK